MSSGKRLIHVCILVSFVILAGCEDYQYCPPGMSWCWAQCVDLVSDVNNCGACGYKCPPGAYCVDGDCVYEGCTTREDCAGPVCLVCKNHECVPPPPVCQGDHDCCVGYGCNFGICEMHGPGCTSDEECLAQNPETPRCTGMHHRRGLPSA